MNELAELEDLENVDDGEAAEMPGTEEEAPFRCGCANCRKLRGTGRGTGRVGARA